MWPTVGGWLATATDGAASDIAVSLSGMESAQKSYAIMTSCKGVISSEHRCALIRCASLAFQCTHHMSRSVNNS